ncbi:mechanosensitive ion channel family protein [Yunchengibacter salinarum]|uniref:mechanosensitive ion channel family protein n=1 Tax=Yunchengibacter salinarum TaxID=3133399 RepID=UPI0035B5F383
MNVTETLKDGARWLGEAATALWRDGLVGVDGPTLTAALAAVLLSLVLRVLVARIITGRLLALARRLDRSGLETLADSLFSPLKLLTVTAGLAFAVALLPLNDMWSDIATKTVRSLVAVSLFLALYNSANLINSLLVRGTQRFLNEAAIGWLVRAVRGLIGALALATVLEIWGINVAALLAGLGLFGVAVALGAQDLFKNLISGLFVLGERRFEVGDWIEVPGTVNGTVEDIGFRTTCIRLFDRVPIYVPNSQLADAALKNHSRMPFRRIYWKVGVEYRTTADQLTAIRQDIEAAILANDNLAAPEEASTMIRLDSFNDSSIDIMVYCFTRATDWVTYLAHKEEVLLTIKRIVESHGASFAFPSQSLYVESLPSEAQAADRPGTHTNSNNNDNS